VIDKGTRPFGRRLAYGNFWHGYKLTDGSYRSRAGTAMSGFTFTPLAIPGADAHLVDFGMPAVATPSDEATLGMERWNKAVLHGSSKRYAIVCTLTGRQFGYDGWPYRCPDGTVYFMRAECNFGSPNLLQIKARILDAQFTRPTAAGTVIASLAVPTLTGVNTVNFSPNGSKAAAHSYVDYSNVVPGNLGINWIVEAAVSGGSLSAAPAVSLTLSYTSATASVQYDAASPMIHQSYIGDGTPVITYTTYGPFSETRKITTTPPVMITPTSGAQRALWSDSVIDKITMIVYDAAGGRHVLAAGSGARVQEDNWSNFAPIQPRIEYDDGPPNAPYIVQWAKWSFEIHTQAKYTRRISRDATARVNLQSIIDHTIRLDCTATGSGFNHDDVLISNVFSGNAIGGWGDAINDGAPLRFSAAASNVLALINNTTTWSLIGYCGAQGDGQYSFGAMPALTGNIYPALNPETGAFNLSIINYF